MKDLDPLIRANIESQRRTSEKTIQEEMIAYENSAVDFIKCKLFSITYSVGII